MDKKIENENPGELEDKLRDFSNAIIAFGAITIPLALAGVTYNDMVSRGYEFSEYFSKVIIPGLGQLSRVLSGF